MIDSQVKPMTLVELEDVSQGWARYRHIFQLPYRVLPQHTAKLVSGLVPFSHVLGFVPNDFVLGDPTR